MSLKNCLVLLKQAIVIVLFVSFASSSAFADLEDDIAARISPAGQVCVFGEECAAGIPMPGAIAAGPMGPQEVYDTFCFACHGSGANNSPVLGDVAAWAPRIQKGIEVLYENALNGFNDNAMPARGLCATCSDDELRAAVDLIVNAAQ